MSAAAAEQPPCVALISDAWSSQASWTVLDTGFGDGQAFLALWQCWRTHARRPALLHYVGVLSAAQAAQLPALLPAGLGDALARFSYALEPGFQRLLLEDGHVSLTLCVGDTNTMLARQSMQADSLVLAASAQPWDKWQVKALARCCKRGAQLVFGNSTHPAAALLADGGFHVAEGAQHAIYDPRWALRPGRSHAAIQAPAGTGRCAVIGAGIAGASVARALALRGFAVDVYDAHAQPAGGASGLPVGLVVPHHSADDSPRSRMSRQGTRLMLQHASRLLQSGQDWSPGGVLELAIAEAGLADSEAGMLSHAASEQPATGWARPMAYGAAHGLWHPHAAWIKPERLVRRWLEHPGIRFHGQAAVHALAREQGQWILRNAEGLELGRAQRVVFANAHGCVDLVQSLASSSAGGTTDGRAWVPGVLDKLQAMQHMHGTLSYGPCPPALLSVMPPFPVNGHGSFVGGIPTEQGPCWYAGATFQSDARLHADLAQEHAANFRKLHALLPAVAQALSGPFNNQEVQAWQGSRCISHDRLPLVGPLEDGNAPTLWLCAGMGARGLSFSALCAELLVAGLCGEPLPLESNLAKSLSTRRPRRGVRAAQTPVAQA